MHAHTGKTIADVGEAQRIYRDTFGDYVSVTVMTVKFTDGSQESIAQSNGDTFGPGMEPGRCEHCGETAIVEDGQVIHPFGSGRTDGHEAQLAAPVSAPEPQPKQDPVRTWSFFGHYDGSELVIDHAVLGEHSDVYPEVYLYDGGVWADSGSGRTLEEAEADARARAAMDNSHSDEEDED